MAIRTQKLHHRIANVGNVNAQSKAAYYPAGQHGGVAQIPGTPIMMPIAQVIVSPPNGGYSTIAYDGLEPIYAGQSGEAIPASAPGHWGQVVAAGRP